MKTIALWLAFLSLSDTVRAFAAPESGTEITQDCYHANEAGERWTYCVHRVDLSVNGDVVYFLHGDDGDAESWVNSPYFRQIYEAWGTQAPVVVSVSYGPHWLLAEPNSSSHSGLYTHFVTTALPAIERAHNLKPVRRLLAEASMGGFNSAHAQARVTPKYPSSLVTIGLQDQYGFFEGSEKLVSVVRAMGARAAYVPVQGPHCSWDWKSVTQFLVEP